MQEIDFNLCKDCNLCSLPSINESVEWVSMRCLERGDFVLRQRQNDYYINNVLPNNKPK